MKNYIYTVSYYKTITIHIHTQIWDRETDLLLGVILCRYGNYGLQSTMMYTSQPETLVV